MHSTFVCVGSQFWQQSASYIHIRCSAYLKSVKIILPNVNLSSNSILNEKNNTAAKIYKWFFDFMDQMLSECQFDNGVVCFRKGGRILMTKNVVVGHH